MLMNMTTISIMRILRARKCTVRTGEFSRRIFEDVLRRHLKSFQAVKGQI
jgi:hypothetical protein